jgi:NAD(P)-dependent dehydrogenase (short-subunit alcohol dehydrogenase family)
MSFDLHGRVALVTGASRGIGFAIASALYGNGVRVAALARDAEALSKAAAELGADPGSFLCVPADVTDQASVSAAVTRAHDWGGRLDILVNNAGPQLSPAPLGAVSSEVLADYLNVKLLGFHRVASAALPLLSEDGSGRIINVAGQTATTYVPNAGVTGITNAAVLAFSKYLAAEAAPRNILVNALSPGMTLTEGWLGKHEAMAAQQGKTADEVRAGMTAGVGIRLGRWAQPSEIANAVLFLASDFASYLSGGAVEVDGGLSKAII